MKALKFEIMLFDFYFNQLTDYIYTDIHTVNYRNALMDSIFM